MTPLQLSKYTTLEINEAIKKVSEDERELFSDGYHTFKELYSHRIKLFIALCNTISELNRAMKDNRDCMSIINDNDFPWKSLKHNDDSVYEGWFIAGIGTEVGKTITYHLPIEEWHNLDAIERVRGIKWDGHTSDDVIALLSKF